MARQESRRLAPHGRPRALAPDALRLARAVAAVVAELGRRVRRYAWPATAGRRNRAYLRDRLVALPLLAVVAFGTLGWAYSGVRGDSAYLRQRAAPALVDLADARASLLIAQGEAERNLDEGRAAELSGLSERYRTRIARATQSLNQVTRSGALTVAEEQELRVVSALVVDYTGWIGRAQGHATDPVLRDAELTYARSMLCSQTVAATVRNPYPACPAATGSAATSIVDRVTGLEGRLRERLADRAAWGPGAIAASVVAALALALLAAGLWRTVAFLRSRFRIRLSVPLALAALPLLAVPFLTADALLALHAQHETVPVADTLAERTSPRTETVAEERPFAGPEPEAIETLQARIDTGLEDGRLAFLDGVAPFVFPTGLATAALIAGALHAYRREYLAVTRPGATA
ncbi:hypothetical protein [Streptomyces sp. SID13726]|uniref:hypothetical protein n=1 Tax=Streptomyces sp. SID13726 TaxID=2706058 RepID=UPI0013BBCCB6|nr:hypothetical protein [Streptomyces sp. SID13726]NEA98713.1 hypothetical protein [Streptomyces sp. SID13726]